MSKIVSILVFIFPALKLQTERTSCHALSVSTESLGKQLQRQNPRVKVKKMHRQLPNKTSFLRDTYL